MSEIEMEETKTTRQGLSGLMKKNKRKDNEPVSKTKKVLIKDYPLFKAIKPKAKMTFHSDYFTIDDSFASVLTVMHHQGSDDNLGYFWGIQLIPRNLDPSVSVRRFEHVARMSESWIDNHQGRAEGLLNNQANETERDGSLRARQRLSKQQQQLIDIATDLMNGSSYLRVAMRLLVKAPTLELLDDSINKINRQYKDRFDTVFATPYIGEQRNEMSNLLSKVDAKMGRNFMFTSAEFAGSYSLVTRGIEDPSGEYIGQMVGDVNNSAVLMDMDKFEQNVVIAGDAKARTLSGFNWNGARGSDLWGTKIGTSALLNNERVVHLVLNRADVGGMGVDLSDITSNVDMTRGDINPFELFGDPKDEMNIFAAHLEKLRLMIEQLQPTQKDIQRARITGVLNDVLNDFYVDKKMWVRNAQDNRGQIRLVGIPHNEVPRLPEFLAYIRQGYHEQVSARRKDPEVLQAFGFLQAAFADMLNTNGDLFNTTTSTNIDRAAVSSRVVYDFSTLLQRRREVMMAQFVNALGFAVGSLTEGDVVVLHGTEFLDEGVKPYVYDKFDEMRSNGVRTVLIYGDAERMVKDHEFNKFERADYTIIGGMTKSTINLYESTLKQDVPASLRSLLEHKDPTRFYLRRGFDNVVFASDVQLGLN